jgi:hypothetical protein
VKTASSGSRRSKVLDPVTRDIAGDYLPKKEDGQQSMQTHGAESGQTNPATDRPVKPSVPASKSSEPQSPKAPRIAYDQSRGEYWRETPSGVFVKSSEKDIKRSLRILGWEPDRPTDTFGVNKADELLQGCQDQGPVDHVFCLAGHRPGIFATADGRRILVPRSPSLIEPREGSVENWERFLDELLGQEQLPHVVDWLSCALVDLYGRKPEAWRHRQILCLAGPPACGKSFLQFLITRLFGGRAADPWPWMTGETSFNGDLAEAEHLVIDDKASQRDAGSRSRLGASMKQLAVSTTLTIHPKGKQAVTLPTFRAVSVSLNDDSDYITVLPPLEASIVDRLILCRCRPASMLPDWQDNLRRFTAELPAMVDFLLKWKVHFPNQRFGTSHFLNAELVAMLSDFEPHLKLVEMIDSHLWPDAAPVTRAPVRMSAADLQSALLRSEKWGPIARQILNYSSACGVMLAKLEKRDPARYQSRRSQGVTSWLLSPPPQGH